MKESNEEFVPKGAIAFFLVMIAVFIVLWASIYFEIVGRI